MLNFALTISHFLQLKNTHFQCIKGHLVEMSFLFWIHFYVFEMATCMRVRCEQENTDKSACASVFFYKYPTSVRRDIRTDGRTDTVLIGRSLSTGRATCLSSIHVQKNHAVPNACQKRRLNRTDHYLFSAELKIKYLCIYPRDPSI